MLTWLMVMFASVVWGNAAAGLDAQQQAELDRVNATLRSAEADLESARSSAGTPASPAQGSRLRLTQMRLDTAVQKLNQAAEWLGKLPADDAAVAQTRTRYDAAAALYTQLNAIIRPDAAPAPDKPDEDKPDEPGAMPEPGEAEPQPAPAPPALHYTEKDKLSTARFHLRDAQGFANRAASVVAQIDDPQTTVVHRQVVAALEAQQRAEEKMQNAMKALAPLPADHPDVAPTIKEYNDMVQTMAATRERLVAAEAELGKLAKLDSYPEYDHDFALLQELARRYANFQDTAQQPELMAQVIREDGQVLAEIQRIAQTYLPLVEQKTPEGERIERMFNHFQAKRGEFAGQLESYVDQLKSGFDEDLAEVERLADEGVEKGRPAYFGPDSGIAQRFGFAQDKLTVLEAFGEDVAAPFAAKLAEAKAEIAERAAAFREQIIQSNTLPADNYKGEDRAAIIACAVDAWSHQQEDAPLITARIPMQAWVRTTKWEWFDGTFYKIDSSRIQVQLVIKHDDRLAVIRVINVVKDHLAGDTLKGMPLWSFEDEIAPSSLMLLEKVKP